jgi:hypothetical protein
MRKEREPKYISSLVKHQKLLLRSIDKSNPSQIKTRKLLEQSEKEIAGFKDVLPKQEFGVYSLATAVIYGYFGYREESQKWLNWSQEKLSPEDVTLQLYKNRYGKLFS